MSRISEIIGYKKEVKKLESICDFLKNTSKYVDFGVDLPKGLLICGEFGVGKTFMAEALAIDCERDIWYVSYNDLTEEGIKKIFKRAKRSKSAVVYIDDIDRLGKEENANVFSALSRGMNESKNGEVFVIMTADGKEYISDYILGELGLDMIIELAPPEIEEACGIFKPIFPEDRVDKNFNMNDSCCFAQNCTYSYVKEAFNNASRLAVYEGCERIHMRHLIKAGLILKGAELTEEFDEATAYHEAGHAAVNLLLGGDAACIVLLDGYGGFFQQKDYEVKTYRDKERRYIVSVAGKACEEIFTGTSSIGSYSDLKKVSETIEEDVSILASQGFEFFDSTGLDSPAYNDALAKKVQSDLEKYFNRAKELIVANRPLVEALVSSLKINFYLLHSEIHKIYEEYVGADLKAG
ncbi:MAG: AAA family ATPase [Muribaculaceae bacterium]|nr:AAA family ATPase [Muribaculaceae bacterium]